MRIPIFATAVCLAMAAPPAVAQQKQPGNPEAGLELARVQCTECHNVEREWEDGQVMFAPDFIDIAESEHNAQSIRIFLRTPHSTMPNIVLTDQQRDDIAAYIMSLKKKKDE